MIVSVENRHKTLLNRFYPRFYSPDMLGHRIAAKRFANTYASVCNFRNNFLLSHLIFWFSHDSTAQRNKTDAFFVLSFFCTHRQFTFALFLVMLNLSDKNICQLNKGRRPFAIARFKRMRKRKRAGISDHLGNLRIFVSPLFYKFHSHA